VTGGALSRKSSVNTSRLPETGFFLGSLVILSHSGQTVVVRFASVLDEGGLQDRAEAKSKFKKRNLHLPQVEEPGWSIKCGTDGSSRGYS
jgi:hypothetical protein